MLGADMKENTGLSDMTGKVVGFSGNFTQPSKTRALVESVASEVGGQYGLRAQSFDVADLGPSFGSARWAGELDVQAKTVLDAVTQADLLVVGSPTYKGSYTGLFKHFFDLLDPNALRGKPVLILATGGGERHALVVEHQLRPLFGFFEALVLPTATFVSERDYVDGKLASPIIQARIAQAVTEAGLALGRPAIKRDAA
jgi:FMN reductase